MKLLFINVLGFNGLIGKLEALNLGFAKQI